MEAEPPYGQMLAFMKAAGDRLVERAGKIADIGITKTDVTEEDFRIERGFDEFVKSLGAGNVLFAEEEHETFVSADNVWVVDPISGTATFLRGEPHYAIVASHVHKGEVVFAAICDPSVGELYIAKKGAGATLNGEPVRVKNRENGAKPKILLRTSRAWGQPDVLEKLNALLSGFEIEKETGSMAVSYGSIARGKYDGVITLGKDSFPEFAGSLLIREAGGAFTNIEGTPTINPADRVFIGGNKETYAELIALVRKAFEHE